MNIVASAKMATATRTKLVSYLRVSTDRQGRNGLGIEAQRAAVARFVEAEGLELIGELVEVETGKGSDALDRRPVLAQAKKAQGVRLGNPTNLQEAAEMGAAANRKAAESFARNVLPVVEKLRSAGITSLEGIARALNERGVRSPRGGQWYASSVKNLLARG
jgi:DNA invertase Pin-like site-specific DNA recombinase